MLGDIRPKHLDAPTFEDRVDAGLEIGEGMEEVVFLVSLKMVN